MRTFQQSQEASFRRMVRDAIRKGPFTSAEAKVTLALVNHWFHHKGARPIIHPGREKLAKRSGVGSIKTVSRALAMLRAATVIETVSHARGGWGKSTHYRVHIARLMTLCGCDWIDQFLGQNVPHSFPEMSHKMGDKMSHGLNDTSEAPISKRGGNA